MRLKSLPCKPQALLATLAFAAGIAGLFSPAAEAKGPILGIGDQQPWLFSGSSSFEKLSLRQVRLTIPIDAASVSTWQRDRADQQINAVNSLGLEALVVFNPPDNDFRQLPSEKDYRTFFRNFRERYPAVKQFAPWNEANYTKLRSASKPARVAAYFRIIREECASCTVLVGSLLDNSNLVSYARKLKKLIGKGKYTWALHNYGDAYRRSERSLRALYSVTRSPVWLVETGGLASYKGKGKFLSKRKFGEAGQAKVVRYLTGEMLRRNRFVKRLYIYQWRAPANAEWDSGVLKPDGSPRPAFSQLYSALRSGRVSR